MDNDGRHLPSEQDLVESVLQGKAGTASRLADEIPACSDFVKDIEAIKNGLASIDDEEPPVGSDEILRQKEPRRFPQWIHDGPVEWYRSPFVLCFGFVVVIWFLYIVISFLMH